MLHNNLQETINAKIQELKVKQDKDFEKKAKELTFKEILKDLTGLEFSVLIHEWKAGNHLSIWVENDSYKTNFDRKKIGEYYTQICTLFNPEDTILKTSSNKIETFAPAKIYFDNNTSDIVWGHTQTANIEFYFSGGLDYAEVTVSFKFPARDGFSNDIMGVSDYQRKMPFGRNSRKTLYYLDMFGRIKMYGNGFYSYCEAEEDRDEFMSVCFYGHVPEFKDGFINGNIS